MSNLLLKNEYDITKLKTDFINIYGESNNEIIFFSSPARINIIGEHIDYNGGKVFPTAINRYLYVAIRKRTDTKVLYKSIHFEGLYEFNINDDFTYNKENDYTNYLNGILWQLKTNKYKFECGFELLIASNIPAGGGISSSSALECGFAYAINETFGFNISRIEIAKIGQLSEHNFMNVNCGIMDQFIISTGKENNAIVLDCNTLEYEYIPLELKDYCFIVMNTNKQRRLADSKYNERREQCENALKILQDNGEKINALCQLTPKQWEEKKQCIKNPIISKRAKHCIYENQRVLDAVESLKNNDLIKLGKLLNESHKSLDEDYEVTGIELNTLVKEAQKQEGCLGSRMTGAGFGGCAIALVHKNKIDSFIQNVQKEYTQKIGYKASFFDCQSGNGVLEI